MTAMTLRDACDRRNERDIISDSTSTSSRRTGTRDRCLYEGLFVGLVNAVILSLSGDPA